MIMVIMVIMVIMMTYSSKKRLTQKQFEILAYIIHYTLDKMYQPGMREISEEFGISIGGAYNHLVVLSSKGWIGLGDNQKRKIEISEAAKALVAGELNQKEWVKE